MPLDRFAQMRLAVAASGTNNSLGIYGAGRPSIAARPTGGSR